MSSLRLALYAVNCSLKALCSRLPVFRPGLQQLFRTWFYKKDEEVLWKCNRRIYLARCFKWGQIGWSELFAALLSTGHIRISALHHPQVDWKIGNRVWWKWSESQLSLSRIILLERSTWRQEWTVEGLHWDRTGKCLQLFHCWNQRWFYKAYISGVSATIESLGSFPFPHESLKDNGHCNLNHDFSIQ